MTALADLRAFLEDRQDTVDGDGAMDRPRPNAWMEAVGLLDAAEKEIAMSFSKSHRWASLSEAEYSEVMNDMPGGLDGYLRGWGWLTFARAVEERLRLKNAPEAPLRADVGAAITEAKNALHQHACHADALADRLATLLKDFPEAPK